MAKLLLVSSRAAAADGPASARVGSGAPGVFVYRFDWDEEPNLFLIADLAQLVGAAHGFEIPFVFGHWDLGPMSRRLFTAENAEGRDRLSGEMMSYWAQFARAGEPGVCQPPEQRPLACCGVGAESQSQSLQHSHQARRHGARW